jgi:TatD DNase family protein
VSDRSPDRDAEPADPLPLDGVVFDAHCHLDATAQRLGLVDRGQTAPQSFVAATARRASAVGVTRIIDVGCEVGEWDATIARLDNQESPCIYGAIAVHPTEVADLTDDDYARLARLLEHPRIVAVGETGLDYYWDRTAPQQQREHFRRHIELAKQVGKPLMIHDRDAHFDVLRILDEEGAPQSGVIFHSFSGDPEMARLCVSRGYVLSFSGVVTFRNAQELAAAAAVTPLEQMLVETDAPFLTPHPFRGRPNSPYLIPHVVRRLAEIKGVGEEVVCVAISATGSQLFGF